MDNSKIDGRASNGGARAGAGRKKLGDKAKPFTLYFRESFIKAKGGKKKLTDLIDSLIGYQR